MNEERKFGSMLIRASLVAAIQYVTLLLAILIIAGATGKSLHGNTRSRIFHQPSCRYYSCPNCTVNFDSAREAVDHGYRPCSLCDPAGTARENPAKIDAPYIGNVKSHKFHRDSCRYASCPNCNAKFKTREEAIKAGYAPGGCCNP